MNKSVAPGSNPADGSAFNLKNNSSLIGFKGTEDLGNGLKGLFQIETNVNMTGQSSGQGVAANTSNSNFGSLRDTYVGASSKYGTVLGGYLSTPFRSALTSFDVMPGATGDGRIENLMGGMRFALGEPGGAGYFNANSSVRATALAYALPTMYGFSGVIAYTGSNNNGGTNQTTVGPAVVGSKFTSNSQINAAPQSALSLNLGWEGYGFGIKGAFQQAKVNNSMQIIYTDANNLVTDSPTISGNAQALTSYLIGAQYTGVPGLKVAAAYGRTAAGMNGQTNGTVGTVGSAKGTQNSVWVGASYRFGNNEPALMYANNSNMSGLSQNSNAGATNGQQVYGGQEGASQWGARWGYYLSKRTQVYGLVSQIKNNANGTYDFLGQQSSSPMNGGARVTTYGACLRSNF